MQEQNKPTKNHNLSNDYIDRFAGVGRVYGVQALQVLAQTHACIIGIGGVGSWCAEALVRSGVGMITLVDLDEVCVTNINRQLHALSQTVGQSKVLAMKERLHKISSEVTVYTEECFYTKSNEVDLLGPIKQGLNKFDVLIDAIDHTQRKAQLIEACTLRSIPIVTCGAAGGRRSPQLVTTADLSQSTHDGLLRRVKKLLKKNSSFKKSFIDSQKDSYDKQKKAKANWGVPAVFSTEHPYYPNSDGGVCQQAPSRESFRLDCNGGFGSLSFVTATFGFVAVSIALDIILGESNYGCR